MDPSDRMDTTAPSPAESPSSLTPLSAALALASPAPTGGYTDYILRSSAPSSSTGWRHNIMKFVTSGERTVDPSGEGFVRPVKLNRKDPRTVRRLTEEERDKINKAAAAAVNPDGMQVDGEEGKVMEEDVKPGAKKAREEIDMSLVGTGTSGKAPAVRSKATMFKKKTKRVFVSSEEARRLKREEWMPWVLEDDEGNERWIGRLEGGTGESSSSGMPPPPKNAAASSSKGTHVNAGGRNGTGVEGWRPSAGPSEAGGGGSSYVAFVFGKDGDDFKVVPANRWYKFNRGPRYATLGTQEAEDEYNRLQKSHEPERWMMHRRPGGSTFVPSASTSVKASPVLPHPADTKFKMLSRRTVGDNRLQVPGGPTLRSVLNKSEGKGGKRAGDAEQDDDEFDYNEEFQDDEEGIAKIDDMADEEETKVLEERIKKEMSGANGVRDLEEEDEEKALEELTRPGREIKKLVKKIDKSAVYESDDEDNPYASSEAGSDDDDDDAASATSRDATSTQRPNAAAPLSSRHPHRSSLPGGVSSSSSSRRHSVSHSNHGSKSNSRHGSPVPSGAALVAQRATSPSGGSGRRSNPGSRSGSPVPAGATKRKRSAGEGGEASTEEAKRAKNDSASPSSAGISRTGSGDGHVITEGDLIAFFKTKPNLTSNTKDVLSHFKKAIRSDARNKSSIAGMLHAVANLVDGELVLKSGL